MSEAEKDPLKRAALLECFSQLSGRDALAVSSHLDKVLMRGAVVIQHDSEASHAFRADETNFEASMPIQGDNRSKPTLDKIAVLDRLVGRFKLAHFQRDPLKMGPQ